MYILRGALRGYKAKKTWLSSKRDTVTDMYIARAKLLIKAILGFWDFKYLLTVFCRYFVTQNLYSLGEYTKYPLLCAAYGRK